MIAIPWSAAILFSMLAAMITFGLYAILSAESNPAHAARLTNVRASPVEAPASRPQRFALEDEMVRMSKPKIETRESDTLSDHDSAELVEEASVEYEDEDSQPIEDIPEIEEEAESEETPGTNSLDSEFLLEEIGKEWQIKAGSGQSATTLDEATGEAVRESDTSEFEERLNREGAQTGKVQVSLIWDNTNDLDLSVVCPSGERISFDHKTSRCGGRLDIDMNESPTSEQPVENIYWSKDSAPKGDYKVFVEHFEHHAEEDLTNFRILVNDGDNNKEFKGEITNDEPPQLVCVFSVE